MPRKKNFLLRIEPKLYEALERWAADEFRSVNAHIEYLLREAVKKNGRWNPKAEAVDTEHGEDFGSGEETKRDKPAKHGEGTERVAEAARDEGQARERDGAQ